MKKETLEDAFVKFMESNYCGGQITKGFVLGAMKFASIWQSERSYSEEDMIDFAMFYYTHQGKATKYWGKDLFKEWFEQFKKK